MNLHPTACWNDVVNAAILGFDRMGARACLPADGSPWSLSSAATANESMEHLLSEIAALAIYESAGRLPSVAAIAEDIPLCSADDRLCSRSAMQHLFEILHGGRQKLLPHWVAAAAAGAGMRRPRRCREFWRSPATCAMMSNFSCCWPWQESAAGGWRRGIHSGRSYGKLPTRMLRAGTSIRVMIGWRSCDACDSRIARPRSNSSRRPGVRSRLLIARRY